MNLKFFSIVIYNLVVEVFNLIIMSVPNELYNAKFAEYIESIKIMYLVDDRFKGICDDYCYSKVNGEVYQKKFEKFFRQKLKYENLSKELEEEILFYLLRNN